eukprot:CAMPEP_0203878810 /NCGR_PEP_ID=MMETSP0359-20131031/23326_1 /ASSEMBLY_ACC=CAM_ASM_000338 /TAXON_ID=268821 /ORGANISM="Scrippsiella Hangoei, Strain SHTV-5" /LENGTH=38 /DNA_ID= /DNA_START= /DNA_END= /DNA_ORIENTATION=
MSTTTTSNVRFKLRHDETLLSMRPLAGGGATRSNLNEN